MKLPKILSVTISNLIIVCLLTLVIMMNLSTHTYSPPCVPPLCLRKEGEGTMLNQISPPLYEVRGVSS
jgi:hypothetical protein